MSYTSETKFLYHTPTIFLIPQATDIVLKGSQINYRLLSNFYTQIADWLPEISIQIQHNNYAHVRSRVYKIRTIAEHLSLADIRDLALKMEGQVIENDDNRQLKSDFKELCLLCKQGLNRTLAA